VTALLEKLIRTNALPAGEVFQPFRSARPGLLTATTEDRFLRRYAEALLSLETTESPSGETNRHYLLFYKQHYYRYAKLNEEVIRRTGVRTSRPISQDYE